MHAGVATNAKLLIGVGEVIGVFAVFDMAGFATNAFVFAGKRKLCKGVVVEFAFFQAGQLEPTRGDMAGCAGLGQELWRKFADMWAGMASRATVLIQMFPVVLPQRQVFSGGDEA